ncbi:hypothetical protein PN451_12550 [Dolichospermum planctonicum CS-1226]|uniref:Nucleic acid binding OB-fold tRNA/helicase-type n=1 Tax=Dolichospermum planctonicum CS-1226 TaxID=3021751 RepID=A0ABT5AJT1_9CYAN|nr:hypothetical protein [Dolichospermum planctonicum]MDB9536645.1 hypothetical protein [Dolichospermum planctonicum CS-1226]
MQQRKIFTWRLFYLGLCCSLITGLYACNNQANSGITFQKFKIAANVTPIQKISQKNQDTTIYIQGRVEKTAPLIKKKAYQISDSTGKIWVITNQRNLVIGEQVILKGNVKYKSIPLEGKEYGEIYLEVK